MTKTQFHPTALIESDQIGSGTRVWAYAHVLSGAVIGSDCNVGDHAFVETGAVVGNHVTIKNHVAVWEGVTIEDDVFVGPAVAFTNDLTPRSPRMPEVRDRYATKERWLVRTIVEQGCTIGANATIVAGVRLGRYSFIGAGATVTKDVPPFALVLGCPARQVGTVCRCGTRHDASTPNQPCTACGLDREFLEPNNMRNNP